MKKALLFSLTLLGLSFFNPMKASAQIISLDDAVEDEIPGQYDRSFMLMTFPFSTFAYHFGYGNMQRQLNQVGGLEQARFFENAGFGIGWRRKKVFYNLNASLPLFSQTNEIASGTTTRIAEFKDGNMDFTVGYSVIPSNQFYWIIRSGIGFHFRDMTIREVGNTPFDFDDFRAPVGAAWPQFQHHSLVWDVAIEMLPVAMRRISVLQSVQLGYKHGLGNPQWNAADVAVVNPIRDQVSMIYFRGLIVISRER